MTSSSHKVEKALSATPSFNRLDSHGVADVAALSVIISVQKHCSVEAGRLVTSASVRILDKITDCLWQHHGFKAG